MIFWLIGLDTQCGVLDNPQNSSFFISYVLLPLLTLSELLGT